MKQKLKSNITIANPGILFNAFSGESFRSNETGGLMMKKVRKNPDTSHLEEFILTEFDIDSETMEEHFQELLKYMMHNQLIDKIPDN